jgi:C-5 cytosine-specific DNA methylase
LIIQFAFFTTFSSGVHVLCLNYLVFYFSFFIFHFSIIDLYFPLLPRSLPSSLFFFSSYLSPSLTLSSSPFPNVHPLYTHNITPFSIPYTTPPHPTPPHPNLPHPIPTHLTAPRTILPTQDALGPLSEEHTAIDRTSLPSYHRRIRRFHPDELLAISGFPSNFIWPKNRKINLEKCSGVVGNSINVSVVRCVMQVLFGIPGSSSSSSDV